jgi:hypothetical protein
MRVAAPAPYELPAGSERTRRPAHPRRIRPGERYEADTMVPIEATGPGDTQVLVARFPGRPREPVIALDGLAQAPWIDSLIVSTEIRLSQPLGAVRELLLPGQTPLPAAETLANLPGLRTLHAPWAATTRKLAVGALAPGLAELAINRGGLVDAGEIAGLSGLRSLELDLYPGDSVEPIGQLTGLVRLSVGGPRVTGWRSLAACELLEEALLNGLTGANLRPFAGWSRMRRLTITRRGLRSLAGIEQLGALEELDLRLLGVEDLAPLAALPRLRSLRLIGLKAAHDLSALGGLRMLERLEVSRAGTEESDIVHIDSVRPLAGLGRLTEVVLFGTVIDDGDLTPLATLPGLRRLGLYRVDGPVVEELRARPELELIVMGGPSAAAAVIHGLPIRPAPDKSWYARANLTERLGVDTNYDAEQIVREAVTRRDGELARRLSFDTEASAVTISAVDEADLHAVAAIIDSLS